MYHLFISGYRHICSSCPKNRRQTYLGTSTAKNSHNFYGVSKYNFLFEMSILRKKEKKEEEEGRKTIYKTHIAKCLQLFWMEDFNISL